MRPKKRILLLDSDEDRRGELAFLLTVKGYAVTYSAYCGVELIIARWPSKTDWAELQRICDCRVLFIASRGKVNATPEGHTVARFMNNTELLDCVAQMSSRKRGPKKRGNCEITGRSNAELSPAVSDGRCA